MCIRDRLIFTCALFTRLSVSSANNKSLNVKQTFYWGDVNNKKISNLKNVVFIEEHNKIILNNILEQM